MPIIYNLERLSLSSLWLRNDKMKERLNCAMDIGEQMLICGAEVHRVEDTLTRICTAFGASRVDVFIITSSMVVTVHTNDGDTYTQTRRIISSGTDFEKLHRLNALSREICAKKLTVQDIKKELDSICCIKGYPFWLECVCYAVIAGAFTLFFGGSVMQSIVSLLIGGIIRIVVLFTEKAVKNKIFSKFISSFAATALAFIALRFNIIADVDKVIIGNIMTLIPGIGLTNALRDLFTGDSIAGLLRSVESLLIAIAIAAGYFLLAFITGGVAV